MTEGAGPSGSVPHGSLAEEASRLAEAAQQWLGQRAGGRGSAGSGGSGVWADAVTSGEQDGPPECRTCPICRARRLMTGASPDVVAHLSEAAAALAAAVRAMSSAGGGTSGTSATSATSATDGSDA